ncbi:MAG: hypothetical protein RIQ93_1783 [Verrucomicrobiota bacterium]|jgi:SWI/SNF-related matrix-associated actin-dependent regulator 1 of chromatin subfamily A
MNYVPDPIPPGAVPPSAEVDDAAFQQALRLSDGLFAHQVEGIAFLLARRRSILADDMGLGKTRQAIVALRHAAEKGPFLVICPASVKLNWSREIKQVDAAAVCTVLDRGAGASIRPDLTGWVIVNYDLLAKLAPDLAAVPWAGLIFDEAHYLKNHTSQRSRFARQLALESGRDPVVYALTGTPLTNRPRDLFPLLQLVRHPLARSFLSFAKRYCAAEHNGYGWQTNGASNLEELTTQLHGIMIRRRKEEVLDLPPKLRTWTEVNVPAGTASAEMREVMESLLLVTGRRRVDAGRDVSFVANPERSRVRLLAKLSKAREKLAASKVSTTIDLIEGMVAQGEKVIVFSCFDRPVKALAQHFGANSVLLNGSTPAADRQALVDRFQTEDNVRVFVANIVAGGVGLNLTAARQVVFNDLDWVPANHWQAEDRAYRIGQTASVNVHYLVARGTIDEFVSHLLEVKSALARAVVDGAALSPAATRDVLAELESVVTRLSLKLEEKDVPLTDEEWVAALLSEVERETAASVHPAGAVAAPVVSRDALLALARVLTRPQARIFRVPSSRDPSQHYTLTYEANEATCSCPGFEFRGTCRHARDLKATMVAKRGAAG